MSQQVKQVKLKLPMPLKLDQELQRIALDSGKSYENVILFLLDVGVQDCKKLGLCKIGN